MSVGRTFSRDQLLDSLRQRKDRENATITEGAKKLLAEEPAIVKSAADETLRQLKKTLATTRQEAEEDAQEAAQANKDARKKLQLEKEQIKADEHAKALAYQENASKKIAALAVEMKETKAERANLARAKRKIARREKAAKNNDETYEFRIVPFSQNIIPLKRRLVIDPKTQSLSRTVVSIDVYEKDGCIGYALDAKVPEMRYFTTTVRAPYPFVPVTLVKKYVYYPAERQGFEVVTSIIHFTSELTGQVKQQISKAFPQTGIDINDYHVIYRYKDSALEEKSLDKKILTIYKKGDYLACTFPMTAVQRVTHLVAPKPFVLREENVNGQTLLEEQILEAASQAGHIHKQQSDEEIREARLTARALENESKRYYAAKSLKVRDLEAKALIEEEKRRPLRTYTSVTSEEEDQLLNELNSEQKTYVPIGIEPVTTLTAGRLYKIDNEEAILDTMTQIDKQCSEILDSKESNQFESTAANEIRAALSALKYALNSEIPVKPSAEECNDEKFMSKFEAPYNEFCEVIEKYQLLLSTEEENERKQTTSYYKLKTILTIASSLVAILCSAIGALAGFVSAGPVGAAAGGIAGAAVSSTLAYCIGSLFFPPPPQLEISNRAKLKCTFDDGKKLIQAAHDHGFENETGTRVINSLR